MLKKKSSSSEKKRKHAQSDERHEHGKRRSTECSVAEDSKDELADPELDRIGSDIEEGGLDLSLPFQPITAYVTDRREMLQQCFHVLGERKLRKMLPDELKDCSLEEIRNLCWEQLEQISEKNIRQILAGEDLTSGSSNESKEETSESQQDSNVDSTSCLKESGKSEDPKQEGGGSSEESDVLSINADTYDSDIEGSKEEQALKAADGSAKGDGGGESRDLPTCPTQASKPAEAKKDIQSDIDKSVNEILALSSSSGAEEAKEQPQQPQQLTPTDILPVEEGGQNSSHATAATATPTAVAAAAAATGSQPSIQQLELLELEMRARAIKALMKASDGKKPATVKSS